MILEQKSIPIMQLGNITLEILHKSLMIFNQSLISNVVRTLLMNRQGKRNIRWPTNMILEWKSTTSMGFANLILEQRRISPSGHREISYLIFGMILRLEGGVLVVQI